MRFATLATDVAVASAAADLLADTVRLANTVKSRPAVAVILPAGKTPLPLFAEILRRTRRGALDLRRVRFFQLDEYVGTGPGDARSFAALLRRELLDPLGRAADHDALLDGAAADPSAEIARHACELAAIGGADLAFLGIGRNGHVAFNEPGTLRGDGARLVLLAAETRAGAAAEFAPAQPPTAGITLGLAELAAARRIGLLAIGAGKQAIVASLLATPPGSDRPASLLLDHPDFTLFADKAAGAAGESRGNATRG